MNAPKIGNAVCEPSPVSELVKCTLRSSQPTQIPVTRSLVMDIYQPSTYLDDVPVLPPIWLSFFHKPGYSHSACEVPPGSSMPPLNIYNINQAVSSLSTLSFFSLNSATTLSSWSTILLTNIGSIRSPLLRNV